MGFIPKSPVGIQMRTLFLTLFATLATMATSTLKDCGSGVSKFTLLDQGFSPDPPTVGDNTTLGSITKSPMELILTMDLLNTRSL